MTKEQMKERLSNCHLAENSLNKQMGKLDYTIKESQRQKKKLAVKISKNMKYRNGLIERLNSLKAK